MQDKTDPLLAVVASAAQAAISAQNDVFEGNATGLAWIALRGKWQIVERALSDAEDAYLESKHAWLAPLKPRLRMSPSVVPLKAGEELAATVAGQGCHRGK